MPIELCCLYERSTNHAAATGSSSALRLIGSAASSPPACSIRSAVTCAGGAATTQASGAACAGGAGAAGGAATSSACCSTSSGMTNPSWRWAGRPPPAHRPPWLPPCRCPGPPAGVSACLAGWTRCVRPAGGKVSAGRWGPGGATFRGRSHAQTACTQTHRTGASARWAQLAAAAVAAAAGGGCVTQAPRRARGGVERPATQKWHAAGQRA